MTDTNQLPPLPSHDAHFMTCAHVYTADQMRAYALQAHAQVQGEAEVVQQAAERYLWLRDGFHKGGLRKTRRPSDAPYVVNPQKSVLYGIEAYRGQELDRAIDEDRLNDLAQHIYEEAMVNGDSRFSDPDFLFSDEFANECLDKARAAMVTTPQPAQAAQAEVTDEQIKMLIPCGDAWKYEVGFPEAIQFARAILALRPERVPMIARSLAEWNEDDGYAVWWAWNGDLRGWAGEPAYIGSPLCDDWPGYHTHWTAHPTQPIGITAQAKKEGA